MDVDFLKNVNQFIAEDALSRESDIFFYNPDYAFDFCASVERGLRDFINNNNGKKGKKAD